MDLNQGVGFSAYHNAPNHEPSNQQNFVKNLSKYQYWQEKLQSWTAAQILSKLRTYGVSSSKTDIETVGEGCFSAYELFKNWLNRFGVQRKFLDNFGFIWAAAERLWEIYLPDLFSVEEFLRIHNDIRQRTSSSPAHVLLPRYLENWAQLMQAFAPHIHSMEQMETLYPRSSWLVYALSDIADCCRAACVEKNKLLLEVVNFIFDVEEKLHDAYANTRGFFQLAIWFSILNNKTEEVQRLLDLYAYPLPIDDPIYLMINDLYTNPLPFAFNKREEGKALYFYQNNVNRSGEERPS